MANRKLIVELIGDSSSLQRAFGQGSRSANKFERDVKGSARGVLAASVSMSGLRRGLSVASASFLGGAGVAFAFKSIIDQSSRVQEEMEKTGVVFGANAADVQAWSKTLAGSFGVSTGAALEAAGTFGNMLRPMGFASDASATMSKRLVELAADMASFNNASPAETLRALQSGLAGQVRPLRQYGVFLSQARIQQEAVSEGISKTGRNLTTQQKTLVAYNIILKDTSNAQGDTARNTESYAVAMSKLTAGIQDTEAALGKELLPTVTEYVNKAAKWLNNTRNQQRLERDFGKAIKTTKEILADAKTVIQDVDAVTGSFKTTLEILIGLRVYAWARSAAIGIGLIRGAEVAAAGEAGALRLALLGIGAPEVLAALAAAYAAYRLFKNFTRKDVTAPASFGPKIAKGETIAVVQNDITFLRARKQLGTELGFTLVALNKEMIKTGTIVATTALIEQARATALATMAGESSQHLSDARNRLGQVGTTDLTQNDPTTSKTKPLTAAQKNTFFDNDIARILMRGGLGTIDQQLAALRQADSKLKARLAVTKDITRRLHLEDEILQVEAQERDLRKQAREDAAKKAQDDRNKRLFALLGLGPTGEAKVPGVARLGREVAQITKKIAGTFLDTAKTDKELDAIRKVIADKALPGSPEVRKKVQEMLDALNQELSGAAQLPKFKHASVTALLSGLGLDRATFKILQARLSGRGPGGTVPAGTSAAFAAAGAGKDIVVHSHTYIDGREVTTTVTKTQQKHSTRRSESRRGPYAGRH